MFRLGRLLVVVVLAAIVLSACAPAATPTPVVIEKEKVVKETAVVQVTAAPGEPIKIGICAPFSGAVAHLGEDSNTGASLAVEEVNQEGGILGHPVQLFIGDNACAPDQAISAVRSLVEANKVDVMIGPVCSSAGLAVMPILEQYGVAMIAGNATNVKLTQNAGVGGNKWFFRICANDGMMVAAVSKKIAETARSVTILGTNNDWGRGVADVFKQNLEPLGINIQAVDYYEQGQPDYHSLITKWKGLNPDAIVVAMESHDGAIMVRQLREQGMTQKLYARGAMLSVEFVEDLRDNLAVADGILEGTYFAIGANPEYDAKFRARFGKEPPNNTGAGYAEASVAMEAARIAIEQTGKADRNSIRDALEKVDMETIYGHIKFDDHNQAHPFMVLVGVDAKGNITVLEKLATQ